MYVREEVAVDRISKRAGQDYELVAFDLPDGLRYTVLYRPPGSEISKAAISAIRKEHAGNGKDILIGDLNMNTNVGRPTPKELRLGDGFHRRCLVKGEKSKHLGCMTSSSTRT